ncbi:hypothetical protein O181_132592 [Austropuccinia psidii MF-1]|uniref:Uncharacterized protein n=1 Tax=Austropuccinia psidii MF-1 TaxID=1389203 RepID=A0A9Q3L7I8_9BASI|nr:hypothetical protein [Austropuccinia psidii MF-1]
MPLQHSPPTKNTRAQRNQAVLTPTERAPLDCTPSVHQLSDTLDRGPRMEGEAPSRRGGLKNEEGESEEKEVVAALAGAPEASEAEDLSHSNQPLVSQAEPTSSK